MLSDIADDVKGEVSSIAEEYEIFMIQEKSIDLESEKNKLNFAKEEIDEGIGIRVIKDSKVGFAYTSDFSKIKETTEQALSNTKLNKKNENISFAIPEKKIEVKDIYDKSYKNLDLNDTIDFLNNIIEITESLGCEVTSSSFSGVEVETTVLNSNGVNLSAIETGFGSGLSVNVIKDGDISTAYDSISSCNYKDLDGDKLSREVSNRALNSLGGVNVETNDYNVVLDYHAAIGLLSTFIQAFSSENVERGRSLLKGKEGTEITDSKLSIIDDATRAGLLGSAPFDGEGTVSKETVLVENGVLNSFLYDIENANKANTKSTSNAIRGFTTTPSVGPTNLIFDFKESVKLDEIKNGVFVSNVLGAHTANPITGDFSVEANNTFKIENGEITKPIKKSMISGNIFELIKNCQKIDSEIKQYGSYVIPKILVHDLRVIGEN
ncbi:MAG: TldD/PmbA family protein [Methanobrevibacter sp.]|nr:TldD/PmbA family protein [Methanobrevibacter sp.]